MSKTLITVGLLAALSTSAFAWDDDRDAYGSRRGGYNGTYPDGSSRPINPGPNGQWNDDEYFARKRGEEAQRRLFESRSSFEPPQTQGPTTFYGPGGKMTLCYPGFNNTMYCN